MIKWVFNIAGVAFVIMAIFSDWRASLLLVVGMFLNNIAVKLYEDGKLIGKNITLQDLLCSKKSS